MMRPRLDLMIARVLMWAARRSLAVSLNDASVPRAQSMAVHCNRMEQRVADAAESLQHARAGLR